MHAPWWWSKTETRRSDIYVYRNVNFNVFFKLIKVHFWWVNSTYVYQNARCNDKSERERERERETNTEYTGAVTGTYIEASEIFQVATPWFFMVAFSTILHMRLGLPSAFVFKPDDSILYIPLDIFPTRCNITQFIYSLKTALRVSDGISTHHQEHTQVYLQYLVLVNCNG